VLTHTHKQKHPPFHKADAFLQESVSGLYISQLGVPFLALRPPIEQEDTVVTCLLLEANLLVPNSCLFLTFNMERRKGKRNNKR